MGWQTCCAVQIAAAWALDEDFRNICTVTNPVMWLFCCFGGVCDVSAVDVYFWSKHFASHGTGTLRCLQKEMATYRHWYVSLWRDPDDVPDYWILSVDKTEWQLISATLCGWRRCFVADQLWLMTRVREEEVMHRKTIAYNLRLFKCRVLQCKYRL